MWLDMPPELERWFEEAVPIYNSALYILRQEFFNARKEGRKPKYMARTELRDILSHSEPWGASEMDTDVKALLVFDVARNWKSWRKARRAYWDAVKAHEKNPENKDVFKFLGEPKMPYYMKNGRVPVITVDHNRFRDKDYQNNTIQLPKSDVTIHLPKHVAIGDVRELILKREYGKLKVLVVHSKVDDEPETKEPPGSSCIGIDLGVNNLVAITASNQPLSWIAKGGYLKSYNAQFNRVCARMYAEHMRQKGELGSKRLQRLALNRYNFIRYEFHCLSKAIVRLCLENGIGTIVIGHNDGWKQKVNLKKNTYHFVAIPFNVLIDMIRYKAERVGIKVVIVEESYTSKCDHLALEPMRHLSKRLGKRKHRGMFKSSTGRELNADNNGAIGMMRKANVISDGELIALRDRCDIVSPGVLKYTPRNVRKTA